jgi:para-aminobenzoate synthetase component I
MQSTVHAKESINTFSQQGKPFVFIIDFEKTEIDILPLDTAANDGVFYDIESITNMNYKHMSPLLPFSFSKKPVSKAFYKKGFDTVQKALHYGNSFLINLTYPTPIATNLTLRQIFEHSKAKYKLLYKNKFVVFSPETFVKIDAQGVISSYPMKGTIDAQVPDAERLILADVKEQAEHNTIVDLIRNDLSRVASKVRVERFRYIDTLKTNNKTLLQVSSEIKGDLPSDWRNKLGDILFSLLPAGSISGAPKQKTLDIIAEAEMDKRGFYTGICGIFDGQTLNSGVLIRYIEQSQTGKKTFRSGGGITVYSDLDAEYQEFIDKIYVPIVRNDMPKTANKVTPFVAVSSRTDAAFTTPFLADSETC